MHRLPFVLSALVGACAATAPKPSSQTRAASAVAKPAIPDQAAYAQEAAEVREQRHLVLPKVDIFAVDTSFTRDAAEPTRPYTSNRGFEIRANEPVELRVKEFAVLQQGCPTQTRTPKWIEIDNQRYEADATIALAASPAWRRVNVKFENIVPQPKPCLPNRFRFRLDIDGQAFEIYRKIRLLHTDSQRLEPTKR